MLSIAPENYSSYCTLINSLQASGPAQPGEAYVRDKLVVIHTDKHGWKPSPEDVGV
jgi:hypothetical protein